MSKKNLLLSLIAVILGFVGGFLLANAINRGEMEKLRAENENLKRENTAAASEADSTSLSRQEIEEKIAQADRDPANAEFQKKLGAALYRYAAMKQDTDLLERSLRLLERAAALQKSDRDLLITVGNAAFDLAYFGNKGDGFVRARNAYQRALELKADDVEVRTDLGLTYFLQEPPDYAAAAAEFKRSLMTDPKHEKTLQFLIQALIKQQKTAEASEYLEQLKAANPTSPAVAELSSMIDAARN